MGDDYSVSWRVLDAQYWGVAQRRKRVFVVVDLDGECAPEILFESKGLQGDPQADRTEGQEAPGTIGEGPQGESDCYCLTVHGSSRFCVSHEQTGTMIASQGSWLSPPVIAENPVWYLDENGTKPNISMEQTGTLTTAVSRAAVISEPIYSLTEQGGEYFSINKEKTGSLCANNGGHHPVMPDGPYISTKASYQTLLSEGTSQALNASDYKDPPVIYEKMGIDNHATDSRYTEAKDKFQTLTSRMGTGGCNEPMVVEKTATEYRARRITPTECARLMGFPDDWAKVRGHDDPTDEQIEMWRKIFIQHGEALGKSTKPKTDNMIRKWLKNPYSDSAEYKMWGNGIAYPCADFIIKNTAEKFQN